jgi:acyl dehydratase
MGTVERKPVEYDVMELGEVLGPVEIAIDEHFVKSTAFTVDDYHPWHLGSASPFGGPIAHGGALLCDLLRLLYTRYDPDRDRGLHQHEEFWLHSPVFVGERVRLTGRFVEKYIKRGRGYVVTEAEARTIDDDRLIIRHRATETTDIPANRELEDTPRPGAQPSRRVAGVFPRDRPVLDRLSASVRVGDPLIGPRKTIHQDQMSIYSGAHLFWHSIHTDREVAVDSGMDDTVAQGLMEAVYLSEWATELFGASWFETGWMSLSFLAPIFPGDTVATFGVISEVREDAGHTVVEIECWVENSEGVKAAVGWFSGRLASADAA